MTKRRLVIATRESPLAMRQAEMVKDLLLEKHPHLNIELLGLTTVADQRLDVQLTEIGGKGLFVKELEEALLDGRADIAVHSMKDVPMTLPPGLILPVIGKREDVRDAFVSNQYESLAQLPHSATVGTSSLRRQTQLRALRADLDLKNLRGNIHTRLKKLDAGEYDAIILAAAGLKRMGLASRIRSYLSTDDSLPAAGQGALGIECREGDESTLAAIQHLNDTITSQCVIAERSVCRQLGGNCQVPIGAYAHIHQGKLILKGLVSNQNGTRIVHTRRESDPTDAEELGIRVAEELLQQGAGDILKNFS